MSQRQDQKVQDRRLEGSRRLRARVIGVVYGSRLHDTRWVDPEIRPLEAKLVEV